MRGFLKVKSFIFIQNFGLYIQFGWKIYSQNLIISRNIIACKAELVVVLFFVDKEAYLKKRAVPQTGPKHDNCITVQALKGAPYRYTSSPTATCLQAKSPFQNSATILSTSCEVKISINITNLFTKVFLLSIDNDVFLSSEVFSLMLRFRRNVLDAWKKIVAIN